jgi:hypothetical protein
MTSVPEELSRPLEHKLYLALLTLASLNVFVVSGAASFLLLLYWR